MSIALKMSGSDMISAFDPSDPNSQDLSGGNQSSSINPVVSLTSGRKRRFVISQQPLGTGDKLYEEGNNTPGIKTLCSEVKSLKQSMDLINCRMNDMDTKMSNVFDKCLEIIEKISKIESNINDSSIYKNPVSQSKSVLFNTKLVSRSHNNTSLASDLSQDIPTDQTGPCPSTASILNISSLSSVSSSPTPPAPPSPVGRMFTESSQIIKLNDETDYPDGSWLGNPRVPEARVRVGLRSFELDNINITCSTAEKMALSLLDNLFTRETLAESNLTGKGKHKKKQLDPLLIFGIYCHLQYVFNIDEADWVRIKNNMEAKCRFLWTRKTKGLPLGVPPTVSTKPAKADTPVSEYTVELVNDPQYNTNYPIYSCIDPEDPGGSRVVAVDAESVYHLEGDFVAGHGQELASEQLLSGTLGGVPVLVSTGSNIMLTGEDEDHV